MLSAFRTLLKISRPRFWFYTAGPFLLGYAAGLPAPRNLFTPGFWLPFLFFLVPANLYLYGINDVFDRDTDRLNQKKTEKEHRLEVREARLLQGVLAGIATLALIILVSLPDWTAVGLFVAFMALCTAYSAPPLRLKGRPFLDSYSNVLYVLPGYLAFYLTAGRLPPTAIIIGGALWAAGMHAYSALPDIVPDRAAGIQTVAVFLGERRGLGFVALNWTLFAILMIGALGLPGMLALIYPIIPLILLAFPSGTIERVYWWFPYLNALIGFAAFVIVTGG